MMGARYSRSTSSVRARLSVRVSAVRLSEILFGGDAQHLSMEVLRSVHGSMDSSSVAYYCNEDEFSDILMLNGCKLRVSNVKSLDNQCREGEMEGPYRRKTCPLTVLATTTGLTTR